MEKIRGVLHVILGYTFHIKRSFLPPAGYQVQIITGPSGLEPPIFGLTGRRVNHYTTSPLINGVNNIKNLSVKQILDKNREQDKKHYKMI